MRRPGIGRLAHSERHEAKSESLRRPIRNTVNQQWLKQVDRQSSTRFTRITSSDTTGEGITLLVVPNFSGEFAQSLSLPQPSGPAKTRTSAGSYP